MSQPVKLETMCGGGLIEAVEIGLMDVLANIIDPNTDATKPRELVVSIKFKPNEHRNLADVRIETKTKLVSANALTTNIIIDKDKHGIPKAAELSGSENPDQHLFPPLADHEFSNSQFKVVNGGKQ